MCKEHAGNEVGMCCSCCERCIPNLGTISFLVQNDSNLNTIILVDYLSMYDGYRCCPFFMKFKLESDEYYKLLKLEKSFYDSKELGIKAMQGCFHGLMKFIGENCNWKRTIGAVGKNCKYMAEMLLLEWNK